MCVSERRAGMDQVMAGPAGVQSVRLLVGAALGAQQTVVPMLSPPGASTYPADLAPHRQRLIGSGHPPPLLLGLLALLRDVPGELSRVDAHETSTHVVSGRPEPTGLGTTFTPTFATRPSSRRSWFSLDLTDPISMRHRYC